MDILIINGPNLNLLGSREPSVYGKTSFDEYFSELQNSFPEHNLSYFQSNIEGEIIDKLHQDGFSRDAIVLNAGGYTHTSIAIGDAVKAITTPVIEVHISNTLARETFRHESFISANAAGVIIGFGLQSYKLAILSAISD